MSETLPWFLGDVSDVYLGGDYLVLDFETTNLDKGSALNPDNDLLLACWDIYTEGNLIGRKHHFGDQYDQGRLLRDISNASFIVAQNAKFELQWLKRCGLELRDVLVYDTMLGEWVVAGNRKMSLSLEAMAERYGLGTKEDTVSTMIKRGVPVEDIPRDWLLRYCQQDVTLTTEVFLKQSRILSDSGLLHIAHARNLVCPVLADIEFNGMRLDPTRVEEEYVRVKTRIKEIELQLEELLDGTSMTSSKQLGEFLYDKLKFAEALDYRRKPIRTPGDKRSTGTEAISKLKPKTKQQRDFLELYKEYNKLVALMTKNLEFFRAVVKEKDGVFYANLNQGNTANHRLASTARKQFFVSLNKEKGAQFQNLPRQYKRLFRPLRDGSMLGEVDGGQLEFRAAVELCRDKVGYKAIVDSKDVHSDTMRELNAAGMQIDRQQAKPETFKPLYGGQSGTKAQMAYYSFFKDTYKQIAAEQHRWAMVVVGSKELTTALGLKFYWPSCSMSKTGYINKTTEIYNYPISNAATGEIIPIALVHFWHRTRNTDILTLNTIHDSIIADFPPEEEERFRSISLASLTTDVYNVLKSNYKYNFRTPLGVGVKVSEFWGEGKERKFDVYPNGTTKELT